MPFGDGRILAEVIADERQARRERHALDRRHTCDMCGSPVSYHRTAIRLHGQWWLCCTERCCRRVARWADGRGAVPRRVGRETLEALR